jgi:isoquinoline 1-oxidoreductase subunit beta
MSADFDPAGPPQVYRLSRRSLLLQVGAVSIALGLGHHSVQVFAGQLADLPQKWKPGRPNAWVTIGTDDLITLITPASEMGQGVMTSIPLLIAEEMDADWQKVRIQQPPTDAKVYGNPKFGGAQATGGSQTTRAFFDMLRLVGAQTRKVLLASAAVELRVPVTELSTRPNLVVHEPSGRTLSYGKLAQIGTFPDPVPEVTLADLKTAAAWRYIGKPLPRIDIPAKVTGAAEFGIDVQLPGMLYGTVRRPAVQGEVPVSVNDAAAKAIKGLIRIVRLPYGVGAIADNIWAARKALDALDITWSRKSPAREYSSERIMADYQAMASKDSAASVVITKRGDAASALRSTSKVATAVYASDHVHHATMEPLTATALVSDDRVDVWGPFQAQTVVQTTAASATGFDMSHIEVHTTLLGGGFGRKYEADFALDAVMLAKSMPGRPVKVIWTREDDIQQGKYRPLEAQYIQVGFGENGEITAWRHHIVAPSILARYTPDSFKNLGGHDPTVTEGIDFNYDIPNQLGEYTRVERGVDVGFLRAIGHGYTKFGVECMLDEVAAATGTDPLEMRLRLLHHEPRAQGVLQAVAEMSGWKRRPTGAPFGIAYSDGFGSHCAQVAEIEVIQETGEIRVLNVWCAVNAGTAIQPENIDAQIMGGIVYGISICLHEQINIVDGVVQEANFNDYRVLRLSEVPEIHIQVINSPSDAPGGIGEAGVPPIGAAIANAFAASNQGHRLRHYPFLPDRVKTALRARET